MSFLRRLSSLHTLTDQTGPLAALLKSRSVLRFTGPDTLKFLNGLLTNDVGKLGATSSSSSFPTPNTPVQSPPIVYAALLTPQGRFLYDFFLYKQPNPSHQINQYGSGPGDSPSRDEVFADVDSESLDELLLTLKRYQLRSKVEIESVGDELSCWQRFGPQVAEKSDVEEPDAASVGWGGGTDLCAMASSQANDSGWQWFKDPRSSVLGLRGIFPSNKTPPLVEADKESDERHYLLWRMQQGVAEGPFEIPKGEAIPLEYNMAGLNAISFEKGCYVGQELIARTHHRGVIRKRLVPMVFTDEDGKESEQSVVVGAQVVGTGGKSVGSVSTVLGCRGMGLLRLEDAFGGSSLSVQGNEGVRVSVVKPLWWPSHWLSLH